MTDLPGIQWIPSNGSDSECFMNEWCRNCARDKAMCEGADFDECDDNELCPIIAAAFRGEAVQWRELEDEKTICTEYVLHGNPIPAPRCQHTLELPMEPQQ